jgi:hypothetical protein
MTAGGKGVIRQYARLRFGASRRMVLRGNSIAFAMARRGRGFDTATVALAWHLGGGGGKC